MRLTIKTKLAGAFGVVIAMSIAAGGLSYQKLSEMTDTQTALVTWNARLDKIGDLNNAVQHSVRLEKNAVLATNQKDVDEFAAETVTQRVEQQLLARTDLAAHDVAPDAVVDRRRPGEPGFLVLHGVGLGGSMGIAARSRTDIAGGAIPPSAGPGPDATA